MFYYNESYSEKYYLKKVDHDYDNTYYPIRDHRLTFDKYITPSMPLYYESGIAFDRFHEGNLSLIICSSPKCDDGNEPYTIYNRKVENKQYYTTVETNKVRKCNDMTFVSCRSVCDDHDGKYKNQMCSSMVYIDEICIRLSRTKKSDKSSSNDNKSMDKWQIAGSVDNLEHKYGDVDAGGCRGNYIIGNRYFEPVHYNIDKPNYIKLSVRHNEDPYSECDDITDGCTSKYESDENCFGESRGIDYMVGFILIVVAVIVLCVGLAVPNYLYSIAHPPPNYHQAVEYAPVDLTQRMEEDKDEEPDEYDEYEDEKSDSDIDIVI